MEAASDSTAAKKEEGERENKQAAGVRWSWSGDLFCLRHPQAGTLVVQRSIGGEVLSEVSCRSKQRAWRGFVWWGFRGAFLLECKEARPPPHRQNQSIYLPRFLQGVLVSEV